MEGNRNKVVSSIIVKCMTRFSRAVYNNRHRFITNNELYDECITLLGILGETTDVHGHCEKLDDAKETIWYAIENYKQLKDVGTKVTS